MLSFYPGPSKVHPKSLEFIQEAYQSGVVSMNHRSKTFEALYQDTEEILKNKWKIPADFALYFVSSATEAWEIVSHSLVLNQSIHFYNGAFGEKWAQYNQNWHPKAKTVSFSLQQSIASFLEESTTIDLASADTICLVQSETSNGSRQAIKRSLFHQNPEAIIAVDATSSMGGIQLPWQEADVWLASVQKCMGLPAGMGLLICSPKALERAKRKGRKNKYNDLLFMEENRQKWQTHLTPNVLSIFLLNKLTHYLPNLTVIEQSTLEKTQVLEDFFKQINPNTCDFLIKNAALRLPTVLTLQADPKWISGLLEKAAKENIILGKGYGAWKEQTFRIANFPSHTLEDIHQLIQLIQAYGL